jgi:hypothetical protein
LRNDHLVRMFAPRRLDVFGFNAGASQQFGDLFRIFGRSTNSRSQLTENFIRRHMSFRAKSRDPRCN